MNFFDELKNFNGLKFKDAEYVVKTNTLNVNFLYNPDLFVLADNSVKVENIIKKYVDEGISINANFSKCSLDVNAITLYAYTTICNNFPAINKEFTISDVKVEIDGLNITTTLILIPQSYEYAVKVNREKDIKVKLEENFFGNFYVKFVQKTDYTGSDDVINDNIEFQNSIKMLDEKIVYKISNVQHIFNKAEYNLAIDFSKISENLSDCVVCGKITRIDKRTYKRKSTSNGETTEIDKIFYTLTINNEGKYLSCTIFPHANEEKRGDVLEVGRNIALQGKFEKFNGRVNFVAKSLCICDIEKYVPPVQYKTVNAKYHTVFPEQYQELAQADMFTLNDDITLKEVGKSFVVFDLETTGLDCKTCEIIEIGAVKIENGKIVSTFSTFVKPSSVIPQEITDLTHITNKMVENAPSINYVIPDFYKFCYGSAIVAHNINFDYGFINQIAKKMNYNFNNQQYDTLAIARNKLLGLRNFKLETIAERLGVSLVGAHRAVNDAMATAKCFLQLL